MSLEFETSRLKVFERSTDIEQSELSVLCLRIPELLTPSVVEHLPPYFHGIESPSDAEHWFYKMVSESRLFVVKHKKPDSIIGLVFAFVENSHDAHIGYLLGEDYWGQGLASELLGGFITKAKEEKRWVKLVGGVDKSNIASTRLLVKLGFVEQPFPNDGQVAFYEYQLT